MDPPLEYGTQEFSFAAEGHPPSEAFQNFLYPGVMNNTNFFQPPVVAQQQYSQQQYSQQQYPEPFQEHHHHHKRQMVESDDGFRFAEKKKPLDMFLGGGYAGCDPLGDALLADNRVMYTKYTNVSPEETVVLASTNGVEFEIDPECCEEFQIARDSNSGGPRKSKRDEGLCRILVRTSLEETELRLIIRALKHRVGLVKGLPVDITNDRSQLEMLYGAADKLQKEKSIRIPDLRKDGELLRSKAKKWSRLGFIPEQK